MNTTPTPPTLDPELAEVIEMLNTPKLPDEVEIQVSEDELTDDPLTEEELSRPGVMEALVAEIQDAGTRALEYKHIIDGAKTEVKKNHYKKKLTRNNEAAADMIVALERIIQVRKQREEASEEFGDAEGHTLPSSTTEKPTN